MKYIFIVNPISGNDNKAKIISRIKSTFRSLDDEMIIEETKGVGDAKNIAASYAEKYGKDCVIVSCGGDGTVHEIANGLAGTDTPVMIIPFGMGNDFAKKVYDTKSINVENVIKSFGLYNGKIKYDIKPIDLIDYNGEKCINVMSFGLDTKVETIGRKIAGKVPFLGHNAYKVAVVPVVFGSLQFHMSYEINCVNKETNEEFVIKEKNGEFALFAVCNASWYGGSFCPAPNSVLDDGLLDVCKIDGIDLKKKFTIMAPLALNYTKGKVSEESSPMCKNYYVTSGHFYTENGEPLLGNCDGENFDYNDLNFHIEKKALKLCVIK